MQKAVSGKLRWNRPNTPRRETIAQRPRCGALLCLFRFGAETADAQEMLEEWERRIEVKIGAGGLRNAAMSLPTKVGSPSVISQLCPTGDLGPAARCPSLAPSEPFGGP
jgi:hypothetical protein